MTHRSPDVDAYIAAAQPFARPILEKIRAAFHEGCPDVREVIKWSFPHFEHNGLLGSMAAFKAHVTFGFSRYDQMSDPKNLFQKVGKSSMGALKVRSIDDLPPHAATVALVREAAALNSAEGKGRSKRESKPRRQATPLEVPAELEVALDAAKRAREVFAGFSASHRNEYVKWIGEAKQAATRQKRIATAIEWLSEGKPLNWKYMKERR